MNATEARMGSIQNNMLIPVVIFTIDRAIGMMVSNGKFNLKLIDFIFKPDEKSSIENSFLGMGSQNQNYIGSLSAFFPSITREMIKIPEDLDSFLKSNEFLGLTLFEWNIILSKIIKETYKKRGFTVTGYGIDIVISWLEENNDGIPSQNI